MFDDLILDDASATDNCGEVTIKCLARRLQARTGNYGCSHVPATDDAGNSVCDADDYSGTTAPELTIQLIHF